MQDLNLDEISRRPIWTLHADGIPDLVVGLTWVLWGILLGIPGVVPKDELWKYYWLVTPLVLVLSGLAGQWTIKKLKERWSYKRAGFVEPLKSKGGRFWALIFIALINAIVVSAFIAGGRSHLDLLPLICSVVVAAAFSHGLRKQGAMGAGHQVLPCILLGVGITAAGLGIETGFPVLWGGLGLTMALRGGWRLIGFMRTREEVNG